MPLDVNGVWQYQETDAEATASDLLNLGMASVSDRVGDLQAAVDGKQNTIGDTGWLGSGYTPASGITVNSFVVRRYGDIVAFRTVFTIASLSVPTNGDVANTPILTVSSTYQPAQSQGGFNSSGVGRGCEGFIDLAGVITLANTTPDAAQTGAVTLTNQQFSLAGTYLRG